MSCVTGRSSAPLGAATAAWARASLMARPSLTGGKAAVKSKNDFDVTRGVAQLG